MNEWRRVEFVGHFFCFVFGDNQENNNNKQTGNRIDVKKNSFLILMDMLNHSINHVTIMY